MSATTTPADIRLPAISHVDRADDRFGLFRSDLDSLRSQLEQFGGDDMPIADAVFLYDNGITLDEQEPREVDPAILARLLVFADELLDDLDSVAEDAKRLRSAVLDNYRHLVIEGRSLPAGGRVVR